MSELDIRKFVNEATDGLIPDQEEQFVAYDVALKIIPKLSAEASKKADDSDEKDSLEVVKNLIRSRAIGIAVKSQQGDVKGIEEDVSLKQLRVPERSGFRLVILVNPTIAYAIESGDDKDTAVKRMKEIMLDAYGKFGELNQKGEFIPDYEV